MKILRLALLALALGILLYGLLAEKHEVHSLAGGDPETVSGPGLVEIATRDGLLRKNGRIFDTETVRTLPEDAPDAAEGAGTSGCAT